MDDIGFKTQDTLALWQWVVLGGFCVSLILAAIVAKWHAGKTKSGLFNRILGQFGSRDINKNEVDFNQIRLSADAKIYQLTIDGHKHTLFETDKGLIELAGESKTDELPCNDQHHT